MYQDVLATADDGREQVNHSKPKDTEHHITLHTEVTIFLSWIRPTVLIHCVVLLQLVMKVGPHGMAGELGVIFGIPQPFTVRSKRLTEVVRIGQSHLLQMLGANTSDADTVHANFVQYLKSLKEHVVADAPFFREILSDTGLVSTQKRLAEVKALGSETCVTCPICAGSAPERRHFSEAAAQRRRDRSGPGCQAWQRAIRTTTIQTTSGHP